MLERLALARPDIAISLHRDAKLVFSTPGRGDLRAAVAAIHGAELAAELLEAAAAYGMRAVKGLITPPHVTRGNRNGFHYHLAGRVIEDRSINHAITAAYEGLVPRGEFPLVFLGLDLPFEEVDVNVHPTKAEVRFRDSGAVHHLVSQALRARLRGQVTLPRFTMTGGGSAVESYTSTPGEVAQDASPLSDEAPEIAPAEAELLPAPGNARFRYIGLLAAGRFLLAEDAEGLVVIDPHAAHERVLFDSLLRQAENEEVAATPLLVPATIELTAAERAFVDAQAENLKTLGFEVEIWPDAAAVKSVPALLGWAEAESMLREIIADLAEERARKTAVPRERLARLACRGAVKGRTRLAPEEAAALVRSLAVTTDPYTCPHGRPTLVRLDLGEIDRRFGRK